MHTICLTSCAQRSSEFFALCQSRIFSSHDNLRVKTILKNSPASYLLEAFAILRAYADCSAPIPNPVCSVTPVAGRGGFGVATEFIVRGADVVPYFGVIWPKQSGHCYFNPKKFCVLRPR